MLNATMLSEVNASFWGMATLGQRIAAAREIAGMSQSELADAVGVTRAAVSQWEKDQTKNLRLENLFEVARITGAYIYWLGTDAPPPAHAKSIAKFARLPPDYQKPVLDQIESLYELATVAKPRKISGQ